jgi:hypothetical protein
MAMTRTIVLAAAAVFALANVAHAQNTGKPSPVQKDPKKEARVRFHSAQAALHSALSHAEALESVAEEPGPLVADVALSHVKTVDRDANECDTDTVKMGQAVHSLEKSENMKTVRSELAEALKTADKAHSAIDGHGQLGAPARETTAHLRKALAALYKLADDVGTKPLPSPSAKAATDGQER